MNRTLAIFLPSAAALFGLITSGSVYADRTPVKPAAEALESATRVAVATAEMINQNAPQVIDDQVRLERADVGPGALVTFNYTLINYDGDDLPESAVAGMRTDFLKQNCTNPALRKPIADGLEYKYLYANKSGTTVANILVSAEGCRSSGL